MPVCACASVYVKHWFPGDASPFSGDLTANAKALQSSCSTHRLAQSWIVICAVTETFSRSVGWRPLDRKAGVVKQSNEVQHVQLSARAYRSNADAPAVNSLPSLYVMHW